MAALIIAIFPQNSSRGNWEEQQDRTDPNSRFELARKPAWLLAFRQFGLPKWKHDFECCTFDHSDNSPCLFSSGFLSRNLFKKLLERKQERRQKIFDFEIFCVEEYQGESGGRNSQLPPKFRVSPVMTTSIPLRVCQTRSEHLEPQKREKTKMLERRVRTAKYLVFRTRESP